MKKNRPLLFFIFCPFIAAAQLLGTGTVVEIHPALGKTITINEKIEYCLFPKIVNADFDYARLIQYNDSVFSLVFHFIRQPELEKFITKDSVSCLYSEIERITPAASLIRKHASGEKPDLSLSDELFGEETPRSYSAPNPLASSVNYHKSKTGLFDLAIGIAEALMR